MIYLVFKNIEEIEEVVGIMGMVVGGAEMMEMFMIGKERRFGSLWLLLLWLCLLLCEYRPFDSINSMMALQGLID